MNLQEARTLLRSSALSVSANTFSDDRADRAIRAAGQKFLRDTHADRIVADVKIASGSSSVNVNALSGVFEGDGVTVITFTHNVVAADQISRDVGSWIDDGFGRGMTLSVTDAGISPNNGTYTITGVTALVLTLSPEDEVTSDSGVQRPPPVGDTTRITAGVQNFVPGNLVEQPYIVADGRAKELVPTAWPRIRFHRDGSASTGRPEMIHWASRSVAEIFPTADQDYFATLVWWRPLIEWPIGTPQGDEYILNIPEQYADDVIHWGARAYALMGLPRGHPEATTAMQQFELLIESARGETFPGEPWIMERTSRLGRNYDTGGYL